LHGGLFPKKELRLFYGDFIRTTFFLLYAGILALLLPTMYASFRNIAIWKKKLASTSNTKFSKNG